MAGPCCEIISGKRIQPWSQPKHHLQAQHRNKWYFINHLIASIQGKSLFDINTNHKFPITLKKGWNNLHSGTMFPIGIIALIRTVSKPCNLQVLYKTTPQTTICINISAGSKWNQWIMKDVSLFGFRDAANPKWASKLDFGICPSATDSRVVLYILHLVGKRISPKEILPMQEKNKIIKTEAIFHLCLTLIPITYPLIWVSWFLFYTKAQSNTNYRTFKLFNTYLIAYWWQHKAHSLLKRKKDTHKVHQHKL